jgi:uncharacterized membrane protein
LSRIDYRDLIAGIVLASFGLFVALHAIGHYTVGEASRMGPGYFPAALGWILVVLGLVIALLAFRHTVQVLHPPPVSWRALIAVPAAILVFSLLVERLGLVPATVALTGVAVLAEKPFNPRRTILLAAGLSLISWLIFTVALGMTLPAFTFLG